MSRAMATRRHGGSWTCECRTTIGAGGVAARYHTAHAPIERAGTADSRARRPTAAARSRTRSGTRRLLAADAAAVRAEPCQPLADRRARRIHARRLRLRRRDDARALAAALCDHACEATDPADRRHALPPRSSRQRGVARGALRLPDRDDAGRIPRRARADRAARGIRSGRCARALRAAWDGGG